MKTLVFGSGLLGSVFVDREDTTVLTHEECDITSWFDVRAAIEHYDPTIVINCAGVVPKTGKTGLEMFRVNALGPHILCEECDRVNAKLIQISTNCVFNGKTDIGYTEVDLPTAEDDYGVSKLLGEHYEYPHLTIRTSFVGLPDPSGRGLLHWAGTTKEKVIGYDHVMWNGTTTLELVRRIERFIQYDVSGLFHVYSAEVISKYQLLLLANEAFGWGIPILPQSGVQACYLSEHKVLDSITPEVGRIDTPIMEQLYELS